MENNNYNGYEGPEFFCVVYQDFYPHSGHTRTLLLEDGSILSEDNPGNNYSFIKYFDQYYKDSYLGSVKTPMMIYSGLGSILQLENYILNNDIIDHINTNGLNFYLYETLVFDVGTKRNFYVTRNKEYYPIHFRYAFELTEENLKNCYAFELESIQRFATNNGIKNIDVFTVEYGSRGFFKGKYPNLTIHTKDVFLISLMKENTTAINCYQINDELAEDFTSEQIRFKFWSGNWRYDMHRHLIILYLAHRSSIFSWAYGDSLDRVKEKFWFDIGTWEQKHPDVYKTLMQNDLYVSENAPFKIDFQHVIKTYVKLDQIWSVPEPDTCFVNAHPVPVESFKSSFVAVINESCYAQPLPTFSEKVVNAIKMGRPFILAAPPRTLEYLQALGFRTFNDFWDESYDQEHNHEQRILEIYKVIDYIDSFDIEQLKKIYDQMLPIIRHNFETLKYIKHSDIIL